MKSLLALVLLLAATGARAQFGVSFHQSNLPFVGLQYELLDGRLVPEMRLGVDNFIEDTSVEIIASYVVHRREDYGIYVGLGLRPPGIVIEGLVLPVGVRAYPFARQRVGLQVEAALLGLFAGDSPGESLGVLRGSAGIHVRLGRG